MSKQALGWTATLALALGAQAAMADTIPFSENFDNITSATYAPGAGATAFTGQQSWSVGAGGTIDIIPNGFGGIVCRNSSAGCIDLDGSNTATTGPLLQSGTFNLLGGHTYQLNVWLSGNQRGAIGGAAADPETVQIAFTDGGTGLNAISAITTAGPLSAFSSVFQLFTVLYTPVANIVGRIGIWDVTTPGNPSDSFGAILDDVRVTDVTAVPLPASAWLLLTGLLALGVVSRRKQLGVPFAS